MTHKIIWLMGQSGAGKTTAAKALQKQVGGIILDGNEMRQSISLEAGFSPADRHAHNVRVARLAKILSDQTLVIVSVIAPLKATRKEISVICDPLWVYLKRTLPERVGYIFEEPTDEAYPMIDIDCHSEKEVVAQIRDIVEV